VDTLSSLAPVAQWTERRPSKPRVGGSNPPRRIRRLSAALLVEARRRYPVSRTVAVAQLVEPLVVVQVVVGSSPIRHLIVFAS
jgi:hypothetical protein